MSGSNTSVGWNNRGCASGPHAPTETPARQALLQQDRISRVMQSPTDEHVTDRLLQRIPPDAHVQRIRAQVDSLSAILPKTPQSHNNSSNGGI